MLFEKAVEKMEHVVRGARALYAAIEAANEVSRKYEPHDSCNYIGNDFIDLVFSGLCEFSKNDFSENDFYDFEDFELVKMMKNEKISNKEIAEYIVQVIKEDK